MIRFAGLLGLLTLALSACGTSEYEASIPVKSGMDFTAQTIHSTVCTRGNSAFRVLAGKDGTATGRILQSQSQIKAKVPRIEFPVTLRALERQTVLLEIPVGAVTDEPVSETLSPVVTGGEIVLRGDTFDCTEVRVRRYS